MNKKEFIEVMQNELNNTIDGVKFTKADADAIIRTFKTVITSALLKGEKVSFPGFGTFEVVELATRLARNPQTGEVFQVDAHKVPKFKVSKVFKDFFKA